METNIIVKRVNIFSFKNIKNLSFDLFNGENLVVEGKNGLGKSNIINAIYWCINGIDLNGCTDQSQFLPFRKTDAIVDVEVSTNVGTFERIVEVNAKGIVSQTTKIDGQVYSLKDFDVEVDKRFGILMFTFNNFSNKDFSLRQFLMNPNYHLCLAPKTIRDVLAKRYSFEMANDSKFVAPEFNPLFLDLLKREKVDLTDIRNYYEPIEALSTKFESDKKNLKKTLDELKIVSKFLDTYNAPKDLKDKVSYLDEEFSSTLNLVEQDLLVLDYGRQAWNECLEKNQKGKLLVKFQTLTSKGTMKNDYSVEDTGINLKQTSTSENIVDSIQLINLYKLGIGCNVALPIFIDRAESINSNKLSELEQFSQLLLTKVTTGRNIKINGSEVK